MTIEYLGIRSDSTYSRNSIDLLVRGDFSLSNSCKIVIERPGQNRPYLAEDGWQSNFRKCLVEVIPSGGGNFTLCLPLAFADYLDPEYNYRVELFDLADESVGLFGMNWTPPPRIRAKAVDPAVQPVVKDDDSSSEDMPEQKPIAPEVKADTYEPPKPRAAPRTVLNCTVCRGQIFSTFKVCPYCGTPVSQH